MKTIGTCLPVYDRLAKQNYERSKASNFDKNIATLTPQWRLPAMQWNVEADAPGEISGIHFYDDSGLVYTKDSGFYGWLNYSAAWNTFTTSGLDILSAIQLNNVDAFAIARNVHFPDTGAIGSGSYIARAGETINIKGTYNHVSGAVNRLCIYDDTTFVEIAGENMATGEIDYSYTFAADAEILVLIHQPAFLASSFSFTDVQIGIDNGISFFQTTDSYIQDGGGTGWSSPGGNTYDTFTVANEAITSAIKTTAAGEDYTQNIVAAGSVPAGITTGERIRIVFTLTLNSGTAPKIVLRNTGTGAAISNVVTLANGVNYVFLTSTATLATGWAITIYNSDTELSNWSATFTDGCKSVLPAIDTSHTDDYFTYFGETLGRLIDEGLYYLKIETSGGYVYYSEWFEVECIYPNLFSAWLNNGYDTLTTSGTEIISAIDAAGNVSCYSSTTFSVIIGEVIRVVFFHTQNSGAVPTIRLYSTTLGTCSNIVTVVAGLNEVELTSTVTIDNVLIFLYNAAATNFLTSEVLAMRDYSEKYVRIVFSNTCDLGDIVYHTGLEQTLWLEAEPMETFYPIEDEGAKDGEALFFRSFARQVKRYIARTKELPAHIIQIIHRMILHDSIELTDLVGDTNTVTNLEAEHEWLGDDKYYAKADLTFDYGEAFVIGGCCNNIT